MFTFQFIIKRMMCQIEIDYTHVPPHCAASSRQRDSQSSKMADALKPARVRVQYFYALRSGSNYSTRTPIGFNVSAIILPWLARRVLYGWDGRITRPEVRKELMNISTYTDFYSDSSRGRRQYDEELEDRINLDHPVRLIWRSILRKNRVVSGFSVFLVHWPYIFFSLSFETMFPSFKTRVSIIRIP